MADIITFGGKAKVEHHSDTKTFSVTAVTPITCTDPTPHYSSGCQLLLAYDTDKDGEITHAESINAEQDYFSGKLTEEEAEFVNSAYQGGGSINAKCTGCYKADMRIEGFSQNVTKCTPGTIFNTGNIIATYNVANSGTATAADYVRVKHLYRTAGETTWHELETIDSTEKIDPNGGVGPISLPSLSGTTWTCPADGVTMEFAIKAWGRDTESEPANPT